MSVLHPDLEKLSFLLGRWEGVGVAGYPDMTDFQFGQEIEFRHDGQPHLTYRSKVWQIAQDGSVGDLVTSETGYWRALPAREPDDSVDAPIVHVEVLLTHPEGFSEVYLGNVFANRVELTTDAVLSTDTGTDVSSGHRLYGLFGDNRETLGYAWDMAARGHDLQSYMSAQLTQVGQ